MAQFPCPTSVPLVRFEVCFTHWSPSRVCRAYADQFLQFPHRTPGVRRSLINVPVSFQLREIKEANQRAMLNALNHPDANITKLLEETEAKYSGI